MEIFCAYCNNYMGEDDNEDPLSYGRKWAVCGECKETATEKKLKTPAGGKE